MGFDDGDAAKSKQDNEALFQEDFLFNWLAPEVLQSTIYTQASDIYSLSLVLWEIMSGEFPFSDGDNRAKTMKEQIIGGRRPDFWANGVPLCCSAYEKVVSLGWSRDPGRRPNASEMAASLDTIWQGSGNSRLEVLQDSRNISLLLSSYLLSKSSNAKEDVDGALDLDHDAIVGGSSLFQPFYDNEKSNTSAEEIMASYQHLAPLRDLYLAINNDPIWKIARSSTDPLLVISGQAPHIVLLMSTKFEALTGLRQKSCFGLCFEDFVTSPKHVVDDEANNQKILSDFYVTLKLNKSAHMVLNFLSSNDEVMCMSIHAMPIYSKDSLEPSRAARSESLTLDAPSLRDMEDFDFSPDRPDVDKDPLYYILDMSQLERLEKEEELDHTFMRHYSTSSMASKLSGLFKPRPSPSVRHVSMQPQSPSRSSSFAVNRNIDSSNMVRTSYSSGNLAELRESFLVRESMTSEDLA